MSVDDALAQAIRAAGEPEHERRAQDPARVALVFVHADDEQALDALADQARALVRPVDTVARTDAGQVAIVAPGAGHDGARRLAQALYVAAARMPGTPAIAVGWGVYPDDGASDGRAAPTWPRARWAMHGIDTPLTPAALR